MPLHVKLAVCIIHHRDRARISDALLQAGFKFTMLESTGGFLRESNATFLIGTEADQISSLLDLMETNCPSREQVVSYLPSEATPIGAILTAPVTVPVGGAVVFVLDVEQFARF